jgi:hypothetical protein
MEALDHESLRACLATQELDRVTLSFGTSADRVCGVPPFDGKRVSFDLWKKLRKGWPTLDSAVFDRDVTRIERWYQARGYYDAAVVSTEFDPPSAAGPVRPGRRRRGLQADHRDRGRGRRAGLGGLDPGDRP